MTWPERAAYAVGEQYAREGQWNLARETFLMMVDRYPAHPRTPDAFRWLIRHNCSSEARRRQELGQFVVVGQLEYGQIKPEAPCRRCRPPKIKKRAKRRQSGRNCRVLRRIAQGGGSRWPVRKRRASGIRVRCKMESRLAAFGPVFADDPTVQFPLQAARRTLGEFEEPKKWYADFVSRQPPGPWRDAAAAELWLTDRVGTPPKPVAYCRYTDDRPYLDGKLDDACWRGARCFHCATRPAMRAANTRPRLAWPTITTSCIWRCVRPADQSA